MASENQLGVPSQDQTRGSELVNTSFAACRARFLYASFALLALAACASSPWLNDALDTPPRQKIEDKAVANTLSYHVRWLLSKKDRQQLEAMLASAQSAGGPDGRTAFVGGASMVANGMGPGLFSNAAPTVTGLIGVGTSVALAFLPDGSMERASSLALPASLSGRAISTPEEAAAEVPALISAAVTRGADAIGRSIECLSGCDGSDRILRLKAIESGRFTFDPPIVLLRVQVNLAFKPVAGAVPLLAGETVPAWITPDGDTAFVGLYAPAEGAKPPYDGQTPIDSRPMASTKLFRTFIAAFTADGGLWTYGNSKASLMSRNGKLYHLAGAAPRIVSAEFRS